MILTKTWLALLIAGAGAAIGLPAAAGDAADAPAWSQRIAYTADVGGTLAGAAARAGKALDNLDVVVDGDLEQAVGWRGATVHAYLLNNTGGRPNDLAGTLQGVDNIEVGRPRTRLFELWLQDSFADGRGSVLVGLYNLNSEFYATETSHLLLAPPFGIGSELAATGPSGPSIFPSSALTVRARLSGDGGRYVQAAVLNAKAATFGDPGGPDTRFDHGALMIAEVGLGERWRLAAGVWRYTQGQPDLRDRQPDGAPALHTSQGVYGLAEYPILSGGDGGASLRGFLRAGVSDGETSALRGAWQAGLLAKTVFASRPDSAFSMGVAQGLLSSAHRANIGDLGLAPANAESSLEITYADRVGRVGLQPDLQVVRQVGGDRGAPTVVVMALRVSISLD